MAFIRVVSRRRVGFCFGRRVRRLGAVKRGQKVSDMIALIPEGSVLVVDAKATSTSFNAAVSELRASS